MTTCLTALSPSLRSIIEAVKHLFVFIVKLMESTTITILSIFKEEPLILPKKKQDMGQHENDVG